jgi:hypothetical protein
MAFLMIFSVTGMVTYLLQSANPVYTRCSERILHLRLRDEMLPK